MTLYANINKHSKYFPAQCMPEPFAVSLNEATDSYCWTGNLNQYRTSDLDFYVKRDGNYFPSGLVSFGYETLERALQNHVDYIEALSMCSDLENLNTLYEENTSAVTQMMNRVISLIPKARPTCGTCGNTSPHCRCDW